MSFEYTPRVEFLGWRVCTCSTLPNTDQELYKALDAPTSSIWEFVLFSIISNICTLLSTLKFCHLGGCIVISPQSFSLHFFDDYIKWSIFACYLSTWIFFIMKCFIKSVSFAHISIGSFLWLTDLWEFLKYMIDSSCMLHY